MSNFESWASAGAPLGSGCPVRGRGPPAFRSRSAGSPSWRPPWRMGLCQSAPWRWSCPGSASPVPGSSSWGTSAEGTPAAAAKQCCAKPGTRCDEKNLEDLRELLKRTKIYKHSKNNLNNIVKHSKLTTFERFHAFFATSGIAITGPLRQGTGASQAKQPARLRKNRAKADKVIK